MTKYVWIAVMIFGVGAGLAGYRLYTENHALKIQLAAIENPAKTEAKVVYRTIIKTIKPDGVVQEETREQVSSVTEVKPVVPVNTQGILQRSYYISGTAGLRLGGALQEVPWGVGIGYNLNDALSCGLRYDTIGRESRIGVEVRLNF